MLTNKQKADREILRAQKRRDFHQAQAERHAVCKGEADAALVVAEAVKTDLLAAEAAAESTAAAAESMEIGEGDVGVLAPG